MAFHHILVPLVQHHSKTGSVRELACVARAISLAVQYQCSLSIIAFEDKLAEDTDWGVPRQQLVNLRTMHWQDILNHCQEKARHQGIEVKTDIVWGRPINKIVDFITNHHSDLIIKTSHQWHLFGMHRLAAGDMNLVRQSNVPVWLIPEDAEPEPEIRNIVVAIDPENSGTNLNEQLLTIANDLSQPHNGSLHILHCWEVKGEDYYRKHVSVHHLAAVGKKVAASHREHIRELLVKIGLENHDRVHVELIKNKPSSGICEFIKTNPVDLLVIGSHNRSGLERWMLGSTAEHILGHIPCPVLVLQLPRL